MPSPAPDKVDGQPLAGQLVVFTGKLSSLGRKDARELVARLGGATAHDVNAKTTMLVVGAEGIGSPVPSEPLGEATDGPTDAGVEDSLQGAGLTASGSRRPSRIAGRMSNKLKRAEELNAQAGARIRIVSEEEFCGLAGVPTPQALKRQYHAMRDLLARYPALREDHLRYLVKCGVIRPVLRTNADTFFAFPDLSAIRQASEAIADGASFRSVARVLLASHQGQLTLDFRLDAAPAKILALRRQSPTRPLPTGDVASRTPRDRALAEECFRVASALDDGDESKREDAAVAYRKALELDPDLVAALINLANIHYSHDEIAEAQALYERAIGLESDFFEAHFNLGNIYHDLGRFAEAQSCYRAALRLNPCYADAHFYLAVTFEKMGHSQDARPHWRAYQELAPQGEWVELAKEFSE